MIYRNIPLIDAHIKLLEINGFPVITAYDRSYIVTSIPLPRRGTWRNGKGEIVTRAQILIPIPPNYPYEYPGEGFSHPEYAIHIEPIMVNGKNLRHVYDCNCKYGKRGWKWLCFEELKWDPSKDNLYTLVVTVIASMGARYEGKIDPQANQGSGNFFDFIKNLFEF